MGCRRSRRRPTTAVGLAARLGAYCWAEQQLFALLGGWIAEIPEPDVKLAVAEHADHAAWRAQRWYELLPGAPPGPDALVVAPAGVDARRWPTARQVASGPDRTVEKLAVAYRVLLPRLAAALRAHLDWAARGVRARGPPPAGALRSTISRPTGWPGSGSCRRSRSTTEALGRLAAGPSSVERALAAAGGIVGPTSVGLRRVGGAP